MSDAPITEGAVLQDGSQAFSTRTVELLEDWELAQLAQGNSVRTVGDRAETIGRMARWCGAPPQDLSDRQVIRWLAKGATGEPWKASTKHTYFTHLNSWFSFLQRSGYRLDNPMTALKAPKRPKNLPHPVAPEHLPLLLAKANRRKTRAMLILALCQGLRAMEIASFHGELIDHIAHEVTITGKGGKVATIPLHPDVAELAFEMPAHDYWFPSNSTRPTAHIRSKSVSQILSDLFDRAGVPGSGHWLRHWFGTNLVDSDVDLAAVRELLRHESLATTQIYVQVSKRRKAEGIERLHPFDTGPRRGTWQPKHTK